MKDPASLILEGRHVRSRTAVLRLGARNEGILCQRMSLPGGGRVDWVDASILADEWPAAGRARATTEEIRARIAAIVERLQEARATRQGLHASLEVRKKRFAWFLVDHHGDDRVALHCKAPDELRAEIAARQPAHAHDPSYVARHGWIGLWLDVPGVDWSLVRKALTEAYRVTAPKSLAARLRP